MLQTVIMYRLELKKRMKVSLNFVVFVDALMCNAFRVCVVLCCIVLCCVAVHCVVLRCTVLYCIVLYCIVLYCIVLYCIVLYCDTYQNFKIRMLKEHLIFSLFHLNNILIQYVK